MLYRITHQIRYVYSAAVFLEPHVFRLRPRCDAAQQVKEFSMSIEPKPTGRHDFLDSEENNATCLWFDELVNSLTVSTLFEVETRGTNPFGYLVTDDAFFQLPVHYRDTDAASLALHLATVDQKSSVYMLAKSVMDDTEGRTIDFLSLLCTLIYQNYKTEIRLEGPPHPPAITIEQRRGSCRDFALLYIAACRSVGLAARFVSGYQEGVENMEHPHLHAWAEVYIPGGGWRGYDPTHGLAVSDRHIALAASHEPAGAAPVQGTLRGNDVTAKMDYTISITTIST
ncbi:MAG: transglutaminase family protein [Desulfobulbaceae bacterium]|nr:transglutaminase family protein [Desulfobulbaceae bacterium]